MLPPPPPPAAAEEEAGLLLFKDMAGFGGDAKGLLKKSSEL